MVSYHVEIKSFGGRLYSVRMEINNPNPKQQLSLPNWIPGSYLIRDFARHIVTIEANVPIQKINSNTWVCENDNQPLTIEYIVYAGDFSVRGAYIFDETCAFFNASSLLLKVHGLEDSPHQVHISPPKGLNWRIATTLASKANAWEFGWFYAPNYDELIDHPVQMGLFDIIQFEAKNVTHYIALFGKHQADLQRIEADIQKICNVHLDLFDGPAPFDKYLFLLMIGKDNYGGLEHQSSCALQIQREALPIVGDPSLSKAYVSLLGLFSHEYFHAWNVKRIKPACFMKYHLDDKSYTRQLWAFEGITSYYDELALVRAKLISKEQYFELLAQTVTRLLRATGRKKQTLVESSFDAWIKFYQPNENATNSQISYYLKGSLVAWLIDIALRINSNGNQSLDDVMRTLWNDYGRERKGVPEGEIEQLINKISNHSISGLISDMLYTVKELPLEEWLNRIGLVLTLRGATASDDLGGIKKENNINNQAKFPQGIFGFQITKGPRVIISQVFEGGAAMEAGICPLDELVAINGMRIDGDSYDKIAKRLRVGQTVDVTLFRQDLLQTRKVVLKAPPMDTAEISLNPLITTEQVALIQKWLML